MNIKNISSTARTSIDTQLINSKPGPYTISFGFDIKPLMDSISKIGLINPLLIIRNQDNHFDVVSGFCRLMALKSLNKSKIDCIDLSDSGLSEFELFILNFYENLSISTFNIIEKGMILKGLMRHITREEVIEKYLPKIDIVNVHDINIYLEVEKMDEQIKKYISEGGLSLKTLRLLLGLKKEPRDAIIDLITKLKLNSNYQYQVTDYLIDISNIKSCSIVEFLNENTLNNLISDENSNNPQKIKHILNWLRQNRFPQLSKAERDFRDIVGSLKLPQKTKIEHPPFFEAPEFKLEILFKDGKELYDKIGYLSKKNELKLINGPKKEKDNEK